MGRKNIPLSTRSRQIVRLLEATERGLGLSLCLHDRLQRAMLPGYWQWHHSPACQPVRAENIEACKQFDGKTVHRNLADHPQGLTYACPCGVREIAVPIMAGDFFAGVLFAGGFAPKAAAAPDFARQLEDCRHLLLCVAEKIGRLMDEPAATAPLGQERRREIMAWIEEHLDRVPRLDELAARLCLSPSRTSRAVRELFNQSFTELVQTTKLNTAAYWLATGRLTITEIALQLGYCDQAHFTRLFSRHFGQSPARYRAHAYQVSETPPDRAGELRAGAPWPRPAATGGANISSS